MSCAVNKGLVGGRCVHAAESDLRSPLVFIKWFFMNLSFFFCTKVSTQLLNQDCYICGVE